MSTPTQIYVVVFVSYDYYRFQENVGATLDIESARKIAEDLRESPRHIGNSEYYPYRDLQVIEDPALSFGQSSDERNHFFIETHTL
jgi:hypothetical protein